MPAESSINLFGSGWETRYPLLFIQNCRVEDRHRFDPDPNPTFYSIPIRLPQVIPVLECSRVILQCFIFLLSIIGVIIFSILNSILKFTGKSIVYLYIWLKRIQVRIRIGRSWMPIQIRIRAKSKAIRPDQHCCFIAKLVFFYLFISINSWKM